MVLRKLTGWVSAHKVLTIVVALALVMLYVAFTELNYASGATKSPGYMGRDMLRPFPYYGEAVELSYQSDAAPDQAALKVFSDFVRAHSGKAPYISLEQIPSGSPQPLQPCPLPTGCSAGTYSDSDVAALAKQYWTMVPWPGQVVVHYLYLDKPSADGPNVLGFSFCATCVVIFKPTVTLGGGGSSDFEAAVIAHEHAHLWGLCALSYDDVRHHCDGTGHSTNPNSLMSPGISRANSYQMSLYLDPNDLADLSDLAWGRL